MDLMVDLHRRLAAGSAGQMVVAVSSIVLVLTSLAGVILWWPMRRRMLTRIRNSGRLRDWHNLIGLAALIPLIIMALTGITFTWGKTLFPILEKLQGQALGPQTPVAANSEGVPKRPLTEALATFALQHPDLRVTAIQPSNTRTAPHKFLTETNGRSLQIWYDPYTLQELGRFDGTGNGPGGWYRQNFGNLHTLHSFPLPVRLMWGIGSLAGAALVASGIWMTLRRWRRSPR